MVAGDFNGPNQPLDVALLLKDRAEVWIYTGNGDGTFMHTFTIPAGTSPTGLNEVRNPQTGQMDLLVGDPFGDVLHLQGKGDGTFQVAGNRASLSVQQLGNGTQEVLLANQQSDRITIQAPTPGSANFTPVVTLADGSHSTLAPGAVQWAKLDKASPYYDAVVVASGSNQVLLYKGTGYDPAGNPTFAAPVSYPVGTNPVAVTIQDLNGDGIPDMIVANQGSNDVSTLFGSWDSSGNWGGTAGPRLKSGGSGPIATTVVTPPGGGLPELVVTNGQSGNLAVLPGVGQGFFNDQNPQILNLPGNPVLTQGPSFFGSSTAGVVVTATGELLGFDVTNFAATAATVFAPAGEPVEAAQALADGHVVAVLSGGAVVDLAPGDGGLSEDLTFAPLTGIPSEPSALAVLQGESGLQVLVTEAGGDRVFVFGIPGVAESPVLASQEAAPTPTVDVSPPTGGSLTLVVALSVAPVLVTESEAAAAAAPAAAPGTPEQAAGTAAVAAVPLTVASNASRDGGEDEVGEQVAEADVMSPIDGLDVKEKLRDIDLYQPTPAPERPAPVSVVPPRQREQVVLVQAPIATPAGAGPTTEVPLTAEDRALLCTGLVEVMEEVVAGPGVEANNPETTDAVFVLGPSEWTGQHWRLLGLAGLALWQADSFPDTRRQVKHKAERKTDRSDLI
jgi:hypothetical protein